MFFTLERPDFYEILQTLEEYLEVVQEEKRKIDKIKKNEKEKRKKGKRQKGKKEKVPAKSPKQENEGDEGNNFKDQVPRKNSVITVSSSSSSSYEDSRKKEEVDDIGTPGYKIDGMLEGLAYYTENEEVSDVSALSGSNLVSKTLLKSTELEEAYTNDKGCYYWICCQGP